MIEVQQFHTKNFDNTATRGGLTRKLYHTKIHLPGIICNRTNRQCTITSVSDINDALEETKRNDKVDLGAPAFTDVLCNRNSGIDRYLFYFFLIHIK